MKKLLLILALLLLASCAGVEAEPTPSTVPEPTAGTTAPPPTTVPVTRPDPELAEQERLAALLEAVRSAPPAEEEHRLLRKFPYPYKAMLCLTSDCDSTTIETFERMHRFLNTTGETEYGPGLGLDIADSFFVYKGSNLATSEGLMSYCQGTDPDTVLDAGLIQKYWSCGWIDSIHAFGDFSNSGGTSFSRELGARAWAMLAEAGIAPKVWIDHGTATNVQNFGAYNPKNASSYQMGDNPDSPYYHTDLTLAAGVRYVWYSRHSDKLGQDFPLKPRELRDGSTVWSFTRYTSEMKGKDIDWNWRPHRLQEQITQKRLDALEEKGQYAVVAQHLTIFQQEDWLREAGVAALRELAARHHESKTILVARTSRLMDYAVAQRYAVVQRQEVDGVTCIRIAGIDDPVFGLRSPAREEVSGLTFYCDDPAAVAVFVGEEAVRDLQVNPPDETGQASVTIPWFAPDTTDYTVLE